MSKSNIAIAVVNPTSINFFREDMVSTEMPRHQLINAIVEGHFDCVRPVRGNDFVGYVNDEGLLLGMEPNALASAIFGQFLCGPCVIVGTVNDKGFVDGDDHNITVADAEFLSRLSEAAYIWRDSVASQESCDHEYDSYCDKCGLASTQVES